ncbi:MAG: hypothetical protein BWY47_00141 [Bacteroidetes bacterium ADurb.Bin302]|nr:MAG: hypothetical protein BWY47_00141 [Bacteroidetes bacterium ADurb.Bin302]
MLYVTVTDNNGCTATDSLKVHVCCYGDAYYTPRPTQLNDSVILQNLNNGSYIVNGVLTINANVNISNSLVYFAPNAKININPNYTLTVSNSYLLAECDTMWDGIYINGTSSQLVVNNNTFIKDAKNAIVSTNGGNIQLSGNITMVNNYKNIVVSNYAGTHPASISATTFSFNSSYSFLPQYPPISATRTYSGIEINNVESITIGNTASIANRNYFDNMDFGIKNYCSNLEVYNNTFQNMSFIGTPTYPPTGGVGIISTAGKFTPKNLTVGGISNGTINTNKFEACYWGIYADYYQNVTVQRDTFNNTVWTSVYLYSHPTKTIKVLSNVITNGIIGIHNGHCFNSTIDINYNRITNNYYGIAALNVNSATVQKLNIYNNYIWNNTYGNGIQVTNIQGVAGSNTQRANISNNFVYINNPDLNNVQGSNGILVNQSPYALIQLNSVSRPSGTVANEAQALNLNGIHIQLSPNSKLCQNTVSYMGCGLRFNGAMANTTLQLNNMLNYYFYGVRLDNAFIGNQGNTANCTAWRNRWNISSSLIRIQGTASMQHIWLYDGPNNTSNLYYPAPNSVNPPNNLQLQNCVNYVSSCSETLPLSALAPYTPVVENTYNYTIYPEKNRYWDKQFYYYDIQNSPLMASSLSSDIHALSFYNMLDANNIGTFAKVNAYMNNEDYAVSETLNNSIIPTNDIEKNRQIVNQIYLDTWAKGRFEFTTDERSVLEAIAYLEPLTGGGAVYSARVMLGINPPVNTGTTKMAQQTSLIQNAASTIYPNPAKDMAYLEYSLIEGEVAYIYFYNIMGVAIKSYMIDSSKNHFEFSTTDFKPGLYFYSIKLKNGKLLLSNKLIIIK